MKTNIFCNYRCYSPPFPLIDHKNYQRLNRRLLIYHNKTILRFYRFLYMSQRGGDMSYDVLIHHLNQSLHHLQVSLRSGFHICPSAYLALNDEFDRVLTGPPAHDLHIPGAASPTRPELPESATHQLSPPRSFRNLP